MRKFYSTQLVTIFVLFFSMTMLTHSANAVIKLRITFSSADWQCYRDQNANATSAELIVWRSSIPNAGNNYETLVARYTITGPLTNFDLNVGSTAGHFTCVLNKPTASQASLTYTSPIDFHTSRYLVDGNIEPLAITCTPPDITPPTPASAATNTAGTEVAVTFNEDVDWFSNGDPADWTVKLNGTATTVTAVNISLSQVLLTVSPAIAPGATVTVDFDDTNQSIYDNNFNAAAAFVNYPVTNNSTATLPILLRYFKGRLVGNGFELSWETTLEDQAKEMVVERSTDGSSFYAIGKLPVRGVGSVYRWVDQEGRGRRFYRLRLVDLDESYKFSPLIAADDHTSASFRIFPNPSALILRIQSTLTDGTLSIRDLSGKECLKTGWRKGQNIDLATLPAGMYVVELVNGSTRYLERLLIRK